MSDLSTCDSLTDSDILKRLSLQQLKHNSLRTSQIKCHDFICDYISRHPGSCSLYSIVTSASRV